MADTLAGIVMTSLASGAVSVMRLGVADTVT
jgi:hypothetical protein